MSGLKDKVAVVGMGCTRFGERYEASKEDLFVEALTEALNDADMEISDIDAFWFGTFQSETAGTGFSRWMKTQYKPVTRIENICCTGTDSFRNACYAVASGAYDVVMAVGLEKMTDSGMSGVSASPSDYDRTDIEIGPPAVFGLLAPSYASKYNVSYEQLREVLNHISYKSHYNGSLNAKAMFRKEVSMEQIKKSPMIAAPYITVMDCSGVADGAACAIIMRTDMAQKRRKDPMYVKAVEIVSGSGHGGLHQDYDFTSVCESAIVADIVYKQAGITKPAQQLDLVELHDCFSITELVLCEDLKLSERGQGWKDVLDGKFDSKGEIPVNIDGGLKSFGHPVGASGLRMIYESWLQFHGKAGKRQLENPKLGLSHNLGGLPWCCVSGISIVGKELG